MRTRYSLVLATALAVSTLACRDDSPTGLAGSPRDGRVFIDNFIAADFQAFAGSKLDAVQLDNTIKFRGSSSLKVTIPAPGDASGGYSGGAFVASQPRDLTGYNALTFYARSSVAATLNVAGIGNDNTGTSQYTSERNAIALTPTWTKYTIPIPNAARLSAESGLFFFAEGPEGATGYDLWLDDIRFETVTNITNPRPTIAPTTIATEVGATQQLTGFTVTYAVDGVDQTQTASAGYFTFTSSTPAVATVSATGLVSVLATGSTNIGATLGATPVVGAISVNAVTAPAAAAPVPTRAAGDVISLFSNTYTNATVDTWSAVWDQADVSDVTIAGNAAKRYSNLVFAGVEFTSAPVNATTMTHFHIDAYVNSATNFAVKLVDFGANGVFGGGDDTEHEIALNGTTSPAITAGAWNSIDLPLSAFTGMTGRGAVAQMIIVGSSSITYIDNVYFYRVATPTAPTTAAPTPTYAAGDVISLFSNAYTNVTVDTWRTGWSDATLTDLQVAGNDTKRYTALNFVGIETVASQINATAMTHFRMDVWTPDAIVGTASLRVKLVDFGANAAFGGGDDVEQELVFNATTTPAVTAGTWITLDIPLSQFTGLTTRGHLAQFIISGTDALNTLFVDNVLLHR
jgi:hypothetical protein